MDRLCDQVDLLLKENKELSGRLRNLEHLSGSKSSRHSVASIARSNLGQGNNHTSTQSTTSRSSHVQSISSKVSQAASAAAPVASTGTNNEPPRVSAFEEQLHRSRVYRNAHANHSESSLVDDGRSTLALSICSSLTLGEVSNISVFALPVFAVELSNAAAYNFARPSEAARINTSGQRYIVTSQDTSVPNRPQFIDPLQCVTNRWCHAERRGQTEVSGRILPHQVPE
jgi:cell division control protein 24